MNELKPWTKLEAPSYWAKVYIAVEPAQLDALCRKFCFKVGLCVTVDPTFFIYTGGAEKGSCIGLINYARFPSSPEELEKTAIELGTEIAEQFSQSSFTVLSPNKSQFFSRR